MWLDAEMRRARYADSRAQLALEYVIVLVDGREQLEPAISALGRAKEKIA
jgi:hypothetical protein